MLLMPLISKVSHVMSNAVVHIGGSWKEPVDLFTLVLSPPGGGKSPAINQILLNPLRKIKQADKEEEDQKRLMPSDPLGEGSLYHSCSRTLIEVNFLILESSDRIPP